MTVNQTCVLENWTDELIKDRPEISFRTGNELLSPPGRFRMADRRVYIVMVAFFILSCLAIKVLEKYHRRRQARLAQQRQTNTEMVPV